MFRQTKKQKVFLILTGIVLAAIVAVLPGCKEQSAESENAVMQTSDEEINQSVAAMDIAPEPSTEVASLDFTVTDIQGNTHSLSDYRGKKVMVIFWATWCPPCREEIPHLVELRKKFSEDQLAMLAISSESPVLVEKFVTDNKMNYTVAVHNYNSLPVPFSQIQFIPTTFFIDGSGQIRNKIVRSMTLEEIVDVLEKL